VKASNPKPRPQARANSLIQEITDSHLVNRSQTIGVTLFGLSKSILICVQTFIEIGQWMVEIQHGGGWNLVKWRRTVSVEFSGLSMSIMICVPNFIETVNECSRWSLQSFYNMTAATILAIGVGPSALRFLDSACQYWFVYRISSRSVNKWSETAFKAFTTCRRPSWKLASDRRRWLLRTQHVNIGLCTEFHERRSLNGRDTACEVFSTWGL
jgi:hypothetical protein